MRFAKLISLKVRNLTQYYLLKASTVLLTTNSF